MNTPRIVIVNNEIPKKWWNPKFWWEFLIYLSTTTVESWRKMLIIRKMLIANKLLCKEKWIMIVSINTKLWGYSKFYFMTFLVSLQLQTLGIEFIKVWRIRHEDWWNITNFVLTETLKPLEDRVLIKYCTLWHANDFQ